MLSTTNADAPGISGLLGTVCGNNGVNIYGRYEIQILDSYENPTYPDGQAGALYGQSPPLVNASKPPGEWQTYDIIWETPRWDADGKLVALSSAGELTIGPASPSGFKPVARAQVLGGKCWTAPVLANGFIYCRNSRGEIAAVDVRKK